MLGFTSPCLWFISVENRAHLWIFSSVFSRGDQCLPHVYGLLWLWFVFGCLWNWDLDLNKCWCMQDDIDLWRHGPRTIAAMKSLICVADTICMCIKKLSEATRMQTRRHRKTHATISTKIKSIKDADKKAQGIISMNNCASQLQQVSWSDYQQHHLCQTHKHRQCYLCTDIATDHSNTSAFRPHQHASDAEQMATSAEVHVPWGRRLALLPWQAIS